MLGFRTCHRGFKKVHGVGFSPAVVWVRRFFFKVIRGCCYNP